MIKIEIKIPNAMYDFLKERSEKHNLSISNLLILAADQYYFEYEDYYPWQEVKEEMKKEIENYD